MTFGRLRVCRNGIGGKVYSFCSAVFSLFLCALTGFSFLQARVFIALADPLRVSSFSRAPQVHGNGGEVGWVVLLVAHQLDQQSLKICRSKPEFSFVFIHMYDQQAKKKKAETDKPIPPIPPSTSRK